MFQRVDCLGAVMTAVNNGAHGIAVSQDIDDNDLHWDTATHLIPELIDRVVSIEKGRRAVNVNAPNLPLAAIEGVATTSLAKWGDAAGVLEHPEEGKLRFVRQPGARAPIAGSDHAAVRDGWIAVSELIGFRVADSDLELDGLTV